MVELHYLKLYREKTEVKAAAVCRPAGHTGTWGEARPVVASSTYQRRSHFGPRRQIVTGRRLYEEIWVGAGKQLGAGRYIGAGRGLRSGS